MGGRSRARRAESAEAVVAALMRGEVRAPSEDEDEDPPQQQELDRILEEIDAVRYHDRWPRHLYWGAI